MTNPYKVELSGCGDQGTKMIRLELTPEDAQRLHEWDLDGLTCCPPTIEVTPIKETEK